MGVGCSITGQALGVEAEPSLRIESLSLVLAIVRLYFATSQYFINAKTRLCLKLVPKWKQRYSVGESTFGAFFSLHHLQVRREVSCQLIQNSLKTF
jgi:hypothetical protein